MDFPRQLARGRAKILRAAERGEEKKDQEEHDFSVKPPGPGLGYLIIPLSIAARVIGALFSTSLAKKNFPSDGTIMIWTLSDSRSAMIFWINSGLSLSAAPSIRNRSASAAEVTRIRLASDSAISFPRSSSARL